MNRSSCRMAAAAAVVLGVFTATHAEEASKPSKSDKRSSSVNPRERANNFRVVKIHPYQVLLAKASAKTCTTETQATCIIAMEIITVDGRDYCLAVAPEVRVKTQSGGGSSMRNVVWELSHAALGGKVLAFHSESGIVLTVDPFAQIKKGGPGNGGASPTAILHHVKTKRDKLGAESAYLPVILWGSSGNEELCAAIDPKIVNVN